MLRIGPHLKTLISNSESYILLSEEQLKSLRIKLITMYTDIIGICERHGLVVMLGYGSVLGAVRHKGFIPWDDDLDLTMPRKDYDKLLSILEDELEGKYSVLSPKNNGYTKTIFAKVIDKQSLFVEITDIAAPYPKGIFVDIFPLDNLPESRIKRLFGKVISKGLILISGSVAMYAYRNDIYKKLMYSTKEGKLTYRIRIGIGFFFSFRSHKKWCLTVDRFVSSFKHTGVYHAPTAIYDWKGIGHSILFPPKKVPFENIEAYIPNDPDTYLKQRYGDYMQIPPPEKRERHLLVKFSLE